MKKTYKGWVRLDSQSLYGPDDILFVTPVPHHESYYGEDETLAYQIMEHIDRYGPYLSVHYFVSDKAQHSADDLQIAWLNHIEGYGNAEYEVHYSEYTGYLWTDEEIQVGGHDLLDILKQYEGKYLHLEIEYSKEPRT